SPCVENQGIAQANSGFVLITFICDGRHNTRALEVFALRCARTDEAAASAFEADRHSSARRTAGATGPLFDRLAVGPALVLRLRSLHNRAANSRANSESKEH